MTLILAHKRFMACDSIQVAGGLRTSSPPGHRKIVRCPDGSLFGSCGTRFNSDALRLWAVSGMDFGNPPKLYRQEGDNTGYYWMWMGVSGRVCLGDYDMAYHEVGDPAVIGESDAEVFARGALDGIRHPNNPRQSALALVQMVMHLATDRCVFTEPPVHIFDLDHPERDP